MKIIGTGLSGLVGSRVVELTPDFQYTNLSLETGVDITDEKAVSTHLEQSDAPWVFHMAAYTNVQKAEIERDVAWNVNVAATKYIADLCERLQKKLLYIDTDYAFDGTQKTYSEESEPRPQGWYAQTKTEGAKRVLAAGGLVIRISNPYRAHPTGKKDWVHKMLEKMQKGESVSAPGDQVFSPTFIDDIAASIRVLVGRNAAGIFHVVGNPLTPFDAAKTIASTFGCDANLVQRVPFADMFKDRVPIPQYAALTHDKVQALGAAMHSFEEGLAEVKKQES